MKAFKMLILPVTAVAVIAGCGDLTSATSVGFPPDVVTEVPPVISSVTPATGPVGTVVTISGIGFSNIPPNNTIIMDNSSTVATDHSYLAVPTSTDFETLTFTVPNDAPLGATPVVVSVGAYASDDNIIFTVTP